MKFCIADSFSTALGKLASQEQKAVKITVFDLQQNPTSPGLKFHRIDKSKDQNFWSIRVSRDIRIIIHKTSDSFLICYVDHHDDAYKWAERRRIEAHPRTGAAQIVEVRERVEEITLPTYISPEPEVRQVADVPRERFLPPLFLQLTADDLLGVGVPDDWVNDVRNASEDNFFDLADHIPAEAAEALLDYVTTGVLKTPEEILGQVDPFAHPDAQRRFRVMENVDELTRALEYPWDKWAIFLHPAQRQVVNQKFSGPARVSGSAGTGKTVVALHRVAHIIKNELDAKILLTTFSNPLANALKSKLQMLAGNNTDLDSKVTILSFEDVAHELFTLTEGFQPRAAKRQNIEAVLKAAVAELGIDGFSDRFFMSEWLHVVDAWQLNSLDDYSNVPRLGRKSRLGSKQREKIWPVFVKARELLEAKGFYSWPRIFGKVTEYYKNRDHKPFTHIIVDEAQDLGVPELRMLAAIADDRPGALFFAGDLGQRIFQEPFSWKALGIDIRGRSTTLKVNYRTSHQIREAVDKLLPASVRDVDGIEEDRRGTVSIFNGPKPEIEILADSTAEIEKIGLYIFETIDEGIPAEEIGIFVRSKDELQRARSAVQQADQKALELSDRVEDRTGCISIGTMHLAKGLEFRVVIVMACDDEILPDQDRIETVADEIELDEVYETERHLFYVACTRAREKLLITGVAPASEFLEDIEAEDI